MPTVTISSKHQITLPVELVRALGLKTGSSLIAELIGGRIVLLPPEQTTLDSFVGSLRGVYGNTVEEIDRYMEEGPADWDRRQWRETFYDLYATDDFVHTIVDALRGQPNYTLNSALLRKTILGAPELRHVKPGAVTDLLAIALDRVLAHGAVRRIPELDHDGEQVSVKYRLVRDFAAP